MSETPDTSPQHAPHPSSAEADTSHPSATDALPAIIDKIGVTRSHKVILVLVALGAFFDVIEQNTVGIVGPSLRDVWGISAAQVGLLSTATFGAMYAGAVLGGWLSDIKGRKTIFAFNLAIYSFGGLVCAFAPEYWTMFAGRIIVGIGLGGELAVGLALLSEMNSTRFRGTAVSLFNVGAGGLGNPAAYGFGFIIIGVLGPALPLMLGGPDNSWRWLFGLLALPAILILYIRRYLPETPRYLVSKGRIDEANRTLSILASGRLNPRGLTITRYLSKDADASLTDEIRTNPLDIFRGKLAKNSVILGICAFMLFGAQFVMLTFLPLVLVARGYDIATSLGFTMLIYLGALLGAIAASFLNYSVPRKIVVGSGAGLSAAFAFLFGFATHSTTSVLIIGFIFQFFVLLTNTAIWAWVPEVYPTRVRAFGTGVISNLGLVAGAALPPVAGALLSSYGAAGLLTLVGGMYVLVLIVVPFGPETFGRSLEELHGEV